MRATSIIAFLFAAGSMAMPLNKRQDYEVVIHEVVFQDGEGAWSTSFSTDAPTILAPPGAPTPAATSTAPGLAAAQPASQSPAPADPAPLPASPAPASPPAQPTPTPSAVSQSTGTTGGTAVENVQALINQATNTDATYVGFVNPADPKFAEMAVYHHNVHRLNHSANEVTYDPAIAAVAQDWCNKCLDEEVIPEGSGLGMNVAFSSSAENYNPSYWITGSWYNSEIGNFPAYGVANLDVQDTNSFNSWGHFAQVVWPGVEKIGCGVRTDCGGGFPVRSACMYSPLGNLEGAFDVIQQPGGGPIVFPNGQNSM